MKFNRKAWEISVIFALSFVYVLSVMAQSVSLGIDAEVYPDETSVQVYVVNLTGVGNYLVSNGSMVVDGALQAVDLAVGIPRADGRPGSKGFHGDPDRRGSVS